MITFRAAASTDSQVAPGFAAVNTASCALRSKFQLSLPVGGLAENHGPRDVAPIAFHHAPVVDQAYGLLLR